MNVVITVAVVILVVYLVLQWLVIRAVTIQPRRELTSNPKVFGLDYNDIEIPAYNGAKIRGWYIPNESETNSRLVIIVPGWGSNASRMIPYAKHFHSLGHSVLMFSTRNQGNSDLTGYSSLYQFRCDALSAVEFADKNYPGQDIILFGHSIGGSATILATAHDTRIKAGVSCSAFADPVKLVSDAVRRRKLPVFPFVSVFFKLFTLYYKIKLDDVTPFLKIKNVTIPFLLLHGDDDKVIDISNMHKLSEKSDNNNVSVQIISGMGHNKLYEFDEFNKSVERFVEQL